MPRARKPYGTAVDPRNGERATLVSTRLSRFALPRRSDGKDYDARVKRMWRALFDDQALSAAITPVDRELVIRWAESVDDWIKAEASAKEDPISVGSMGQEVTSPHYAIAAQAMSVIVECERQLGIGALNRARLGIALLVEHETLDSLNARFAQEDHSRWPDPRLV